MRTSLIAVAITILLVSTVNGQAVEQPKPVEHPKTVEPPTTPPPPAPPVSGVLDSTAVQQATLIKARAGELDRARTDAIADLEAAAKKLADNKAEREKLNALITQVTPLYLKSLGAKDGDTFDWGTLSIKAKPVAKK